MPMPFYASRNMCHHMRSERKDAFSLINCLFFPQPFRSSNIQRKKVLPGLTTFDACCSLPTNNCKSLTVLDFFPSHSATNTFSVHNFSSGSRKIIFSVSNSIPKKVMHVVGPSTLSVATETLNLLNRVSRACRSLLPSSDPASEIIRKSSK